MAIHDLMTPELQKRIIAAGVMIPVVLAAVIMGGMLFTFLVLLLTVLIAFEWSNMLRSGEVEQGSKQFIKWQVIAVCYSVIPSFAMIYVMNQHNGLVLILFMMLLVWATDVAAYFAGRIIGGPKLIPSVSPNKTWAGLAGGMLAAAVVGFFMAIPLGLPLFKVAFFAALMAVVSQAGDFCESSIKRHFGVKDSGSLIPGHGGVMDRVDGFLFVAPLFALLVMFYNGSAT